MYIFFFLFTFVYYIWKVLSKKKEYRPGSNCQRLDPVSSSILLSEADPEKCAQVNIVSLIIFEEQICYSDFRDRFIENVILPDSDSRFRYRLDSFSSWEGPKWVQDNKWDPLDNCALIEGAQTMNSVKVLLARRLTDPLDRARPLWDMQFAHKFTLPEGRHVSAVILTMHHSMGDGFTLCHQIVRRTMSADTSIPLKECFPFSTPSLINRGIIPTKVFSTTLRVINAILKLLFMRRDPVSALRRASPRTVFDQIVTDLVELPFSVNDLKVIAKNLEKATKADKIFLNDVIVAATTLALGELISWKHDVTSAIWIGLNRHSVLERPHDRSLDWGNANLGTCYLSLPTSESDPLSALHLCHNRLSELKGSPEPLVANRILKALGSIPLAFTWPFRNILMDKMSVSVSNFPGPVHPIMFPVAPDGLTNSTYLGVGTVKSAFFSVAPPFSYGPYITIISYAGKLNVSVAVAEKLMPQDTISILVHQRIPNAIRRLNDAALRVVNQVT